MKKLFALLFLTAAFASCSNEESEKNIQLASGTSKNYTVYADETTGSPQGGITFTTTGPWTSTITDTTTKAKAETEPSWISISPNYGNSAGEYTITINLTENTTGKDRKAVITIECGTTKINITIEQKATTETGENPGVTDPIISQQLISKIHGYIENSEEFNEVITFDYDEQNRIISYTSVSQEIEEDEYVETTTFEYVDNIVYITTKTPYETINITAYLNDEGLVVKSVHNPSNTVANYTYNSDNQLILIQNADDKNDYQELTWENGNITKITHSSEYSDDIYYYDYYDFENKETFDIFYYRNAWDEQLTIAGLTGSLCKNLLRSERGSSEWAYKDDFDMEYEFDTDGYIIKTYQINPNLVDSSPYIVDIIHTPAQ